MQISELVHKYWLAVTGGLAVSLVVVGLLQPPSGTDSAAPEPEPVTTTENIPDIRDKPLTFEAPEVGTTPSPAATPSSTPAPLPSVTLLEPERPVPVPAAPAPPSGTVGPSPLPTATATNPDAGEYAKIEAIQDKYDTYAAPGTTFVVGPMPEGECRDNGAHGCTTTISNRRTGEIHSITITILPGHVTDYLVIHEIMHSKGIHNECAADKATRKVIGNNHNFHYC